MEPHSVSVDEDLDNAAKQVEVCAFIFLFSFVVDPYPKSIFSFSPPVFMAHHVTCLSLDRMT